jgi:hypothetical protein
MASAGMSRFATMALLIALVSSLASAQDLAIAVQGPDGGGEFLIYDAADPELSTTQPVEIKFTLKEKDDEGENVGILANPQHKITSWNSYSPSVEVDAATSTIVTFDVDLGDLGHLIVKVHVLAIDSDTGSRGDIWIEFAVKDWDFCAPCMHKKKSQTGSFLELEVELDGLSEGDFRGIASPMGLGNTSWLNETTTINISGADTALPPGYPKVVTELKADNTTSVVATFLIPKFDASAIWNSDSGADVWFPALSAGQAVVISGSGPDAGSIAGGVAGIIAAGVAGGAVVVGVVAAIVLVANSRGR